MQHVIIDRFLTGARAVPVFLGALRYSDRTCTF